MKLPNNELILIAKIFNSDFARDKAEVYNIKYREKQLCSFLIF